MVQKQLDFLGFDFYAATFPENRKIPPGTRGGTCQCESSQHCWDDKRKQYFRHN